jgi:flagellar protein FliO/FliZ
MGNGALSMLGSQALQVLLGTGLVIALLLAFLWVLRRYVQGTPAARAQRRVQILEAHSLGPRQRLVLVRVDGEDLLLGMTATEIRTLWPGHAQPGVARPVSTGGIGAARAAEPRWPPTAQAAGASRDWVSVQ